MTNVVIVLAEKTNFPFYKISIRPEIGRSPKIQNLLEGIVLQTWNLASRLNSPYQDQVKCHGWSATIPSLVTLHPKGGHTLSKIYQKELCYKLEILHLDLTQKIMTRWTVMDGLPLSPGWHPPFQGWSPTIQNLPKVSLLQTWNLALGFKSQNKDQVKCHGWSPTIKRTVTHHPKSTRNKWSDHHTKATRRNCTTDMSFCIYT